MLLTDYHVHSDVSQDSDASMYDMAAAEAKMGIEQMCFTNHCDMCHWREHTFNPRCLTAVPETLRKFEEMKAEHGLPLDIRLGLEIGEPLFAPDTAREIAQSEGLDMVIGSLHILRGVGDLWLVRFESMEQCRQIFDMYLDELIKTAELDFFDIMAHIGYVRRYMFRQGFDAEMSLALYGEKIRRLLRRLIDNGRGIEINCSGIRDGCGPFPQPEILSLYRELGGRIITVGSDAHRPGDAAKCIREGYQVLRDCGFEEITTFKEHKPEFIRI